MLILLAFDAIAVKVASKAGDWWECCDEIHWFSHKRSYTLLFLHLIFSSTNVWLYFMCIGTLDAIIKMIRYEGLRGFYKGMSTKIVQSVFAASVLFMLKEELVKAYMLLTQKSQKVVLRISKR